MVADAVRCAAMKTTPASQRKDLGVKELAAELDARDARRAALRPQQERSSDWCARSSSRRSAADRAEKEGGVHVPAARPAHF